MLKWWIAAVDVMPIDDRYANSVNYSGFIRLLKAKDPHVAGL